MFYLFIFNILSGPHNVANIYMWLEKKKFEYDWIRIDHFYHVFRKKNQLFYYYSYLMMPHVREKVD